MNFNQENSVNKNYFNSQKSSIHHSKASSIVSIKQVCLEYKHLKALSEVNLNINHGEILFLTGPSGAGKTSLLKIIGNEIKPTTGQVIINNNVSNRKKIFFSKVFQDTRFMENKSLLENILVSYDSSIFSNKKNFLAELDQLATFLGAKGRLDLLAHQANGGLRQKASILRALMSRPDVILADEPTSSLDRQNASRVFDILNYYNTKHNLTVIWASHNHDLVKQFSGRIVHLNNGKLIYSGHACFI